LRPILFAFVFLSADPNRGSQPDTRERHFGPVAIFATTPQSKISDTSEKSPLSILAFIGS
ncbi:MAG: hypothetical protein SPI72_01880, partial [Porphyromonas sp.]|nr:hypothetical protein [Porphyromonas sp.]